jgi:uncharacterized RDD family membrane protein YckC
VTVPSGLGLAGEQRPGSLSSWQRPGEVSLLLPPLAAWGDRARASLIDLLLVLTPLALAVILAAGVDPFSVAAARGLVAVGGGLSVLTAVALLAWQGRTGQTFGKQVLGLSLVGEADAQPIGVAAALRRGGHRLAADLLPAGLGLFRPLRDPLRRQTFADRRAGTVVVYTHSDPWRQGPR